MQHRKILPSLTIALLCFLLTCQAASGRDFLFGLALEGLPESEATISDLEKELQIPISLVNVFLQWPSTPEGGAFPLSTARIVTAHGATLVLTWEPMFNLDGSEVTIPAEEILTGRWDSYINRFAKAAAAWGGPCIIRFAHEMNLQRYHWGTAASDYGPGSPARYRLMFRYVVSRVREAGAGNVRFAFCPNIDSVPSSTSSPEAAWNNAGSYYPGDGYVDILGMDGYNWGTTQTVAQHGWQSSWRDFEAMFSPLFNELSNLASTKPLYVFETATTTQGGNKAQWLYGMVTAARKWQLEGLIWFQMNKELDWRLQAGLKHDDLKLLRTD